MTRPSLQRQTSSVWAAYRVVILVALSILTTSARATTTGSGGAATSSSTHDDKHTTKKKTGRLPNILLLLTDDQDSLVGGMAHMPILERLLKQRGVTFEHGFVHTPICCPSRSSILSGRYLHNGGALNNTVEGNCNGPWWQEDAEQSSMAALLKTLGYQTSYAGKYLNMYGIPGSPGCQKFKNGTHSDGCRRVPPGWDRWLGLIGNSQYYNYGVIKSVDGGKTPAEEIRHGKTYDVDYFPDLVANFTLESIRQFATTRKRSTDGEDEDDNRPFLAVAAWPTAHMPCKLLAHVKMLLVCLW